MDFKKINGKYYINNKETNEDTYLTLITDEVDRLNKIGSDKIVVNKNCIEQSFVDNHEDCECEDCENIFNIIDSIEDLDRSQAYAMIVDYIEQKQNEAFMNGMMSAYSDISKLTNKLATKIEIDLEDENF